MNDHSLTTCCAAPIREQRCSVCGKSSQQGPYKCGDCGEMVENAVSLLAGATSKLFCKPCAKLRVAA